MPTKSTAHRRKSTRRPAFPALLVFDFDGVLTDNRVYVFADGDEAVACNRSDGIGFDILRRAQVPTLILSTERHGVVEARARKLRTPAITGCENKAQALREHCAAANVTLDRVMFVGNDLNDLEVMGIVGWPVCPSDAHPRVRRLSRTILRSAGGAGVAREIAERLLGLDYSGDRRSGTAR
jgi:N-acylneuraminate cytidylyltransferase